MPCYTEPHSYCHHGIEDIDKVICDVTNRIKKFDESRKREEGEFQDLKKHSDKLTDMMCSLCLVLENCSAIFPTDIKDWWEKHKEWDNKRKESK